MVTICTILQKGLVFLDTQLVRVTAGIDHYDDEGILLQQFMIYCDLPGSDLNKLKKEMHDFNMERRGVAHEGNQTINYFPVKEVHDRLKAYAY